MHYINEEEGLFVVLEEFTGDFIKYYDPIKGLIIESVEDFTNKWPGITMLIAPDENSGEQEYLAKRNQEKLDRIRVISQTSIFLSILILISLLFLADTKYFVVQD